MSKRFQCQCAYQLVSSVTLQCEHDATQEDLLCDFCRADRYCRAWRLAHPEKQPKKLS